MLEKITKGFANHRRIQIIFLLKKNPELSVLEIADRLNISYETASDHIRKISSAGLLLKRADGTFRRHKLSSKGEVVYKFLKSIL